MGLKISRGRTLPIGVDLGTTCAKLAQLKVHGDGAELLAAGAAEIPLPAWKDRKERLRALATGIPALLRSQVFHGRQCILSLPAQDVFIQHVKIPRTPAEEVSRAVRLELQGKLPYPVEQAVVRHIVAGDIFGEGEPRQEVIAVSARRSTVEEYLDLAHRLRLDVVGVNVECCAIVECFARLFQRNTDTSRTILYLDIGHASTQVVLSHGSRIVFARNLAVGGETFDRAIAEGMGIRPEQAHSLRHDLESEGPKDPAAEDAIYHVLDPPVEAMVQEVMQCIRYYESVFRNQGIERAIFLGGQAYDKRLCQTIARQLNLPAQVADPLTRVKRVEGAGLAWGLDRRSPQPDWAVAIGLSLGAELAA